MQLNRPGAALAAALSAFVLAGCGGSQADVTASAAQALDVTACFDIIGTLQEQTAAVQFTSSKDQVGLLGKLSDATVKLQLGKNADAVQKLQNYLDKVRQLVAQGKIAPSADGTVTPQMLIDGALMAIACIQPV